METKTTTLTISLLARPSFNASKFVEFLAAEGFTWRRSDGATPAEELVEAAGRICYMSFGQRQSPRTNAEYLRNLLAMGHESVFEHVTWTFLLAGVSRAFTHQLVRHRVGFAFSQLSQQYHDESDADFVEPAELRKFPELRAIWYKAIRGAQDAYRELISRLAVLDGATAMSEKEWRRALRSAARSVLPNATSTKVVVTANARALRHFFDVRGGIPGDSEMRQVSVALLHLVQQDAPSLFEDYEVKQEGGLEMVVNNRIAKDAERAGLEPIRAQ